MRRVVWSKHAHNDFRGIIGYIAQDNPAAALKVANAIETSVNGLAAMPTGRKGRVSGTYEKVVPGLPYIIAFVHDDEQQHEFNATMIPKKIMKSMHHVHGPKPAHQEELGHKPGMRHPR